MTQRRFLAAFGEIQDISYEAELMSRGKVILDFRNNTPVHAHIHEAQLYLIRSLVDCGSLSLSLLQPVVIRTALKMSAMELATLIDSYCMVYTPNPHSRMTGGMQAVSIV